MNQVLPIQQTHFRRLPPDLLMWCGAIALMLMLLGLLLRGQINLLSAVLAIGILLLLSVVHKTTAVLCSLAFLILLGDIRRISMVYFGHPKLDLLLLVGPALAFYLAFPSFTNLRLRDLLSKAFFAVLVMMVLEIFNPQQGSLAVGASGALFYIAPALWFWVGRQYASPALLERFFYSFLLPLSITAAVLGLSQTFIGFMPYEENWINHFGFSSLHVGGTIRAFGFSVAPSEYAALLALGSACTIAAAFAGRRGWLLVLPLLVGTLFLASSRGLILKLLFATSVVYVLRQARAVSPLALIKLAGVLAAGLGLLFLGARHLGNDSGDKSQSQGVQALVSHQTGGFSHPLDSRYSTAAWHGQLMLSGIVMGFTDPVGHGLGSTTLANGKFSGDEATEATEVDFSDMFIALGLVGGFAYCLVLYGAMRQGLRFVREVPLRASLPVIACLSVTITSWLRTGEYSTNAMACFFLGAISFQQNAQRKG